MIRLSLLGYKGLVALNSLSGLELAMISDVVIGKDRGVENDYASEIAAHCSAHHITYYFREEAPEFSGSFEVAIGWRWLLGGSHTIIVFHDSILPRLRGFNPLVTALINGDREIGVTCLLAHDEYDKGDIIGQQTIHIRYPITIQQAIEMISPLYANLLKELIVGIKSGNITAIPQDEEKATYSLWRDEEDYFINWQNDAAEIKRFIDAVGYPYKGAVTRFEDQILRIRSASVLADVKIENRTPGKVIFRNQRGIAVVCGKGLLLIEQAKNSDGSNFDLSDKFRIRFES
jgi:methionyl-tRNA formyltransferase